MRARLALRVSGVELELREIILKNKPQSMLDISPKGTVPVLQLPGDYSSVSTVIDESFDVMLWALSQSDPDQWLAGWDEDAQALVTKNDGEFKTHLDHYKYADRSPEYSAEAYRQRGEVFLLELEARLLANGSEEGRGYLLGPALSLVDMAIFPFVRQFAHVDKAWFDQSPYPALINWLSELLDSEIFQSVMLKLQPWQAGDEPVLFRSL